MLTRAETGSFDPNRVDFLRTSVKDLLRERRRAEFRSDNNQSVEVSLHGIRRAKIGIVIRDNNPEVNKQDGRELYPFRGLAVASSLFGRITIFENIGAKSRNRKGVLVDWKGGDGAPVREQRSGRNPWPDYQPDLDEYVAIVKTLDQAERLDKYGRTKSEQEREKRVVNEFNDQAESLLTSARLNGTAQKTESIVYLEGGMYVRGISMKIYRYSMCYLLPYGAELTIKQQESGLLGVQSEIVIDLKTREEVKEYKIRNNDGRLGVTELGKGQKHHGNPVQAEEGEELTLLLKSLS